MCSFQQPIILKNYIHNIWCFIWSVAISLPYICLADTCCMWGPTMWWEREAPCSRQFIFDNFWYPLLQAIPQSKQADSRGEAALWNRYRSKFESCRGFFKSLLYFTFAYVRKILSWGWKAFCSSQRTWKLLEGTWRGHPQTAAAGLLATIFTVFPQVGIFLTRFHKSYSGEKTWVTGYRWL